MEMTSEKMLQLPFLAKLPRFQSCSYLGEAGPKLIAFRGQTEEKVLTLFLAATIDKEESLLWKSCQEMLAQSFKVAAQSITGFFGYELLSADLSRGLAHFNPSDFSKLLANHSRQMSVGEKRLIQYGPFWGVWTKRLEERWGKIDLKTYVEVYPKSSARLDLYLKKILRDCAVAGQEHLSETIVLLQVIGSRSVYCPGDQEQSGYLKAWLDLLRTQTKEPPPSICILHQGEFTDLV
ncbi:MAG: hypothetical protein PHN49_04320 [Candidatus Omnitrophica bacterium]|nr:hypothetical protein [Candidatus Omnitrophota bacterium]MDD5670847.1 hypothetical protein [Candidatus Omnitrophota bacterium]